ncbi:hypothetical protein [Roseiconus lacunae]|uniref:Helix-turn-helix domain-containing protein n=1 Tax=Roseiconus lacunae TaxID=2605694 RepID=A0ABT7PDR1_9BACT|nr:hypothetical protein [Roseiconus lacunae]MDM4014616.1 hypothetical protein [Roseiconus lacunae]
MTSYSIKSLATRWDCDHKTIRRMIESGQLKTFRIGVGDQRQSIRIRGESVEHVELGEVGSEDDRKSTRSTSAPQPSRKWV